MQLESEVIQAEGGIVVLALKGRLIAGPRLTIAEAQVKSIVKQGASKLVLDLARWNMRIALAFACCCMPSPRSAPREGNCELPLPTNGFSICFN